MGVEAVVEIAQVYGVNISREQGQQLALSLGRTLASLGVVKGGASLLEHVNVHDEAPWELVPFSDDITRDSPLIKKVVSAGTDAITGWVILAM